MAIAFALITLFTVYPAIKAIENNSTGISTPEKGIRRGYKPSKYKNSTGTEVVKFGFFGGEFSRIINTYEYCSCCRPTYNDIDGCSAPVVCPKYTAST